MSVSETLNKQSRGAKETEWTPFYRSDAFWRGFASVFDLFGRNNRLLYYGRDPQQADYEALRGDWEAVGADLRRVMVRFELQNHKVLVEARQQRLFDPDEKA